MEKKKYTTPMILKQVIVELENEILDSSVVTEDTKIKTTGQKVETYDFSDSGSFNIGWE